MVLAGQLAERVERRVHFQEDTAPVPAVAAVRAAPGDEPLPPKADTPVSASPATHMNLDLVDQHNSTIVAIRSTRVQPAR